MLTPPNGQNPQDPGNKEPQPASGRDNISFIQAFGEDPSRQKSNLVQAPSITLPKGGGAIKSIDEKFQVNPSNGTASFSIPLPLTPGRGGAAPSLSLAYNSGSGNGTFGVGWGIDIAGISRRTDKALPQYRDAEESDTFILSGAEDLVPLMTQDASGNWARDTETVNGVVVSRYRPRIESGFARIERLDDGGNVYWRTTTKDNVVSVFGQSDAARMGSQDGIFKWCLEYTYDPTGNVTSYYYKKENSDGVSPSLCEQNRQNGLSPFTNIYLKGLLYGNQTVYNGVSLPTDFLFEVVFDYGEHDAQKPTTAEVNVWPARVDPFSGYKAGFEVRTYRLCQRVLMFHHFAQELGWADYLVRSIGLAYDSGPAITYLSSITQTGYCWNTDGSLASSVPLPPMEFTYVKPGFSQTVQELAPDDIAGAPVGLDGKDYQWIDLYNEGISGILSEQDGGWFYKENRGNGQFGDPCIVRSRPSLQGLREGSLTVTDLEADGVKCAVVSTQAVKGYFELSPGDAWEGFRAFQRYPNIDLKDPNLKFLDLNGDGIPDMLLSLEQEFVWYEAKGKIGYDDYHLNPKAPDEEQGPRIVFADQDQQLLIALADMTGDGLSDIVLITYAGVSYYPNQGYGYFGARVHVETEGVFDSPDQFDTRLIRLVDVDGTGTADIIYTGGAEIRIWFNQSGNSLSAPSSFFNPFPELDGRSRIDFLDLLGTGTSCIVWSSPLPAAARAPLRYIDIMNGRKPHLLTGYKNNMGNEVTLGYRASTQFYLDDKRTGHPWITRLPFAVQCVNKVVTIDRVSQTRYCAEYGYHHGYYDAVEREFRGFAQVTQRDTEEYDNYVLQTNAAGAVNAVEQDVYQPVVITKTWYHTGAYHRLRKLVHQLGMEYFPTPYTLPEVPFPDGLAASEVSECFRTLKGLPLRQEVYSNDGDVPIQGYPYSVTQHNYVVQRLQPRDGQKYAAFFPNAKETLILQFERNPTDPRISHTINVEIDPFGNVLQSASIAYGRVTADPNLPMAADKARQTQQWITYAQNTVTAAIDTDAVYRLPVPCETQTWELTLGAPAQTFFTSDEVEGLFAAATTVLFEQTAGTGQKRKIAHQRSYFLKDDLSGPLPLGQNGALGLSYQQYQLAYTPTLMASLYGAKATDALLRNQGNFVRLEGDNNYWVPSGLTYAYPDLSGTPGATSIGPPTAADLAFASANFYLPVAYQDNFGNLTKVFYDPHRLLTRQVMDAIGNTQTVDAFNYRTAMPYLVEDANGNRRGVRYDALGRVISTFVMGKATEYKGDYMDPNQVEASAQDQPTSTLTYDLRYYASGGTLPNRVIMMMREQHYYVDLPAATDSGIVAWLKNLFSGNPSTSAPQVNPDPTWQTQYAYSDGSGHEVLKKIQAAPGLAPSRDAQGRLVLDASGNVVQADTGTNLRWIGNGRTIFNNKGNPVKQYEPFYDSVPEYNTEAELVEIGFTPILYYDALGRLIHTDFPDGTLSRVVFDNWMQQNWDQNDTVLESTWYQQRINGALGEAQQEAATKAAVHASTPAVAYLDSLGRVFLAVTDNKTQRSGETVLEEFYYTRNDLDILGHTTAVIDARGNEVMTWAFNILGKACYQDSMDAGERWLLADTMGRSLRLWDSRQQVFSYTYDVVNRPLTQLANTGNGAGDITYVNYVYGETLSNALDLNLRGQVYQQFDTAGVVTNLGCDFKGNILSTSRQLLQDYTTIPNWTTSPALDTDIYTSDTLYDALNRPVMLTTPDDSVFIPGYDPSNQLNALAVEIQGASSATNFITNITYTAKLQRQNIYYGNGTLTQYTYDPQTDRLIRLLTTGTTGSNILQDLAYTFDPVGNITRQFDNAQKTVFYGGQQVEAQSDYIYDAIYRLIEGAGREHTGQVSFGSQDNWDDGWCNLSLQPNSPLQLRNYTEKYFYDMVGNLTRMQHIAGATGSWTRTYQYNAASNQLVKTTTGGTSYAYTYNPHGSLVSMPQLPQVDWNLQEEMQHAGLGGGGDVYFVYDNRGQRVRKVVVHTDGSVAERIYLGHYEIYREMTGSTVKLERETLHILDDGQRVAMVETRTAGNDGSPAQLFRYQYSNHIGNACLELDDQAKIITYEEYHPYGTSAYRATDASRQVPAKRYRFTGMERDEETGLNYHTARYYIPWLGRWAAADPVGMQAGVNLYAYVKGNPVASTDRNGLHEETGHGLETFHLAILAGWKEKDAANIALGAAGVDHDPDTLPTTAEHVMNGVTVEFHFPGFDPALANVEKDIKGGVTDLRKFGVHLHALEDFGFADAKGPHSRGGGPGFNPGLLIFTIFVIAIVIALLFVSGAVAGAGIGVFLALFGLDLAVLIHQFAVSVGGGSIGHPWRTTERGDESTPLSHVADEFYQDPEANKKEYLKVFDELKKGAAAYYGKNAPKAGSQADAVAIIERGTKADNPTDLAAFMNAKGKAPDGTPINKSYVDWVRDQHDSCDKKNCTFKGIYPWDATQIDATQENVDVKFGVDKNGALYVTNPLELPAAPPLIQR